MGANTLTLKKQHVAAAPQSRSHVCHWPGCNQEVPPAMWGCKTHWFMLPKFLRDKVWVAYQIGQETSARRPTMKYTQVAREVQQWIAKNHPPITKGTLRE